MKGNERGGGKEKELWRGRWLATCGESNEGYGKWISKYRACWSLFLGFN